MALFKAPVQSVNGATGSVTLTATNIASVAITEATTSKTLAISDANSTIVCTNSGGTTTITVPSNATAAINIGSVIRISNQTSTQLVSLSAAGGVTILGGNETIGPNGSMTLQKISTNLWQVLNLIEYGTHNTNWSGIWASPVAGNINYYRTDKVVTLVFPADVTGNSNTASIASSTVNLPARLRPASSLPNVVRVFDNGALQTVPGLLDIFAAGNMSFYKTLAGGSFSGTSGSGTSGLSATSVNYIVS